MNVTIEDLKTAAGNGNVNALFELLDRYIDAGRFEDAEEAAKDAREGMEIGGAMMAIRQKVALRVANGFLAAEREDEAAVWALRVMLDGPDVEALKILGAVAELRGEEVEASVWLALADRAEEYLGDSG